ncbi:unnamed protein product [Boreogadus saida]
MTPLLPDWVRFPQPIWQPNLVLFTVSEPLLCGAVDKGADEPHALTAALCAASDPLPAADTLTSVGPREEKEEEEEEEDEQETGGRESGVGVQPCRRS